LISTNQRNHNQNREDFFLVRGRGPISNGPNAAASITPTLIRHWLRCVKKVKANCYSTESESQHRCSHVPNKVENRSTARQMFPIHYSGPGDFPPKLAHFLGIQPPRFLDSIPVVPQTVPLIGSSVFTARRYASAVYAIGNESVPMQLAQCRFPALAISSDKILIYF